MYFLFGWCWVIQWQKSANLFDKKMPSFTKGNQFYENIVKINDNSPIFIFTLFIEHKNSSDLPGSSILQFPTNKPRKTK